MNQKWMFVNAILFLVTILMGACSISSTPSTPDRTAQASSRVTFRGTVKTGAELGEVKQHCAEGLYLVAEEGFLVNQTSMLLLRVPNGSDQPVMFSDLGYAGKSVEVVGKYPAQEAFCEALICECEDYILVERIEIR
jgi:hypothetical protein